MRTSISSGFRRRRTSLLAAATAAVAVAATVLIVASSPDDTSIRPDLVSMTAPEPAEQITQLSEHDSKSGRTAIYGYGGGAAAPHSVCEQDAKWLRLRFTELSLRGDDSITVSGTAGGSFTFTGKHWPGKAFHTRAFEGDCVRISPDLSHPASSYSIDAYQSGDQPLAQATVTVAAVGDVCGSNCDQTAPLVEAMNPQALILAGDNAYNSGTLSEYRNNYDPYYGQFKSITYPTPGNHEYNTSGASGYFQYFGARAGEPGKGYYSFDVGDWHFIALNSNISRSSSSAQVSWLRNDLAANTKPCTAAYWHHPRFSRGSHGDDTSVTPFYSALYDAGADLIVVGHDHNYVRFAPSRPDGTRDDANGVRQLLIGTGGRGFYRFDQSSDAEYEASNDGTFGVGKLTLTATGYTAEFVPVAGRTFTDRVTGTCHNATTTPDFGVTASPAAVTVVQGATATTTATVSSVNGFNAAVDISVSGLPTGVTATINPDPVTPPANGTAAATVTLTAAESAPATTANVTITGTSGALTHTATVQLTVSPSGGGGGTVFADDFELDRGWVTNPSGSDTATTGMWERGDPEPTIAQNVNAIKQLGDTTSGVNCLSTGGLAGTSDGSFDVDAGVTSVRSPQIGIPAEGTASLSFQYNVAHGNNSNTDDFFRVKVIDGANVSTVFEVLGTASTERNGAWIAQTVDVTQFAGRTIQLQIEAADAGTGSLWEAQVDDVSLTSTGNGEPDFTVAADPTTVAIPQGQKNFTTITVGSVNGFNSPVDLTVAGAPADVQTTWQTNPVTPPGTSMLVINTTDSTAEQTFDLTVTGTSGTVSHAAMVRVTVTGAGGGQGFSDDFETDKGWTVNPSGSDTATAGMWERGDPEATERQLGDTTSGSNSLVTGRLAGSSLGTYDVDGGTTTIRSPQFTVPAANPRLSFQYSVGHSTNSSPDDFLRIKVIDGSNVSTVFEVVGAATTRTPAWIPQNVNVSQFAGRNVQLLIETADAGTASLWEAQVDDLTVAESSGGGGFTDDFETDKGWTVNPSGSDTADTGIWERGDPEPTIAENVNAIKQLGDTTSGVNCLSTGRLAGTSDGTFDVDAGVTSIRSPQITVASGTATLSFQYNVAHGDNSGTDDFFRVKVIDGANVSTVFEVLGTASTERNGAWIAQSVNLSAFAGKTIHLLIETADAGTPSLWEAQVDDLTIT